MSKISAFTITTNPIKNQYPVMESILSWLPVVDEIVIVDGGSTDGFIEEIEKLNNPKIKLIQNDYVKWEDDWTYWRMGYNLDKAFICCTGDIVVKFDTDYILHEGYDIRKDFEVMEKDKILTLLFSRLNFMLVDRWFEKRRKTLAVNMKLCKEFGLDVRWGYDLPNWGMCDEAIIWNGETENKLLIGNLLALKSAIFLTKAQVFNYGYCFRDSEVSKELMFRNMRAFWRQSNERIKTKEEIWADYLRNCDKYFNGSRQIIIPLESHPKIIQERIKNLTSQQQGYNFWGLKEKAHYYV